MVSSKRRVLLSEVVGYLLANPARSAIIEHLLDKRSAVAEQTLTEGALAILARRKWKSDLKEVQAQLALLHSAGLIRPLAKGDMLLYQITKLGVEAGERLFAPEVKQ